MTYDVIVGLTIIAIIIFGVLFQKPARRAIIKKLARTFVDVCNAHFAKQHIYQRGAFAMPDDNCKLHYEERGQALRNAGCTEVGDTENISLRPILPGGGYFQKHFVDAHHEHAICIFHLNSKQGRKTISIRGQSISTFFNTGTVLSSIAVEHNQLEFPVDIPSQIIFNHIPFDDSVDDFLRKHQHEVELYLDNNQGSQIEPIRDFDDCLHFANEKQAMMHEHVWKTGDPISQEYIAQHIDPRFRELVPDIKLEVDRLLEEDG